MLRPFDAVDVADVKAERLFFAIRRPSLRHPQQARVSADVNAASVARVLERLCRYALRPPVVAVADA